MKKEWEEEEMDIRREWKIKGTFSFTENVIIIYIKTIENDSQAKCK